MIRPIDAQPGFAPDAPPFWVAHLEPQMLAKEDDEQEDDDDLDEDDEEEDEEEDDPATLKAQRDEARAKLERVKAENARRRAAKRKADEEAAKSKPKTDEGDDDVEARIAAARAEGTAAGDKRIRRVEARSALRTAGVADDRVARAVQLLGADLDDLDVTDDGVDGLDELVDALKEEWPELFERKRRTRRAAGPADDDREKGGGKPMTASERQAKAILGR